MKPHLQLLADKDALINMMGNSHDFHMSRYDQQEEILVTGVNQEMEQMAQMTHANELNRNRSRVIEIASFVDRCFMEINHAEDGAI
jgi:hypothetical protein